MPGERGDAREFNPILRTKLHQPQLAEGLVNRDQLIRALNRADRVPLTLISAPAGYGKSILVAQWAQQLDSPTAWLSLDAGDGDLRTFVEYFVAAVDSVSPDACKSTGELVTAARAFHAPVLANYLLNDLDAIGAPFAIVLDDYHRIGQLSPVHDLLQQMLEHPPRQCRFVVVTRQDPPIDLPSLRAGHQILDVRLRDLRFTAAEIRDFLSSTTEVPLSDEALARAEREADGWAAGLRLVSLALKNASDPDAFLKGLHGGVPQIQDYLLREVMAAQPAGIRDLLLASSVLDRFCTEVLDAILEPRVDNDHSRVSVVAFLDRLQEHNLFTIPLDAHGKWFRYHHYFKTLLNTELRHEHGSDRISVLHLRASEWFESEGLIDEAINHALAAEDPGRAAELVARHRHDALDESQWFVLDRWLALVSTETVRQRADLLMARAWITLNYSYQAEAVPPLLAEVESLVGDGSEDEQVRGELAVCRGYISWLMGNGAESLQLLDGSVERIPVSHVEVRSNAEMVFAQAQQMVGRKEEGLRFLDDLLAQSESVEGMREARLLMSRACIYFVNGDLLAAELANRRMWAFVERDPLMYALLWTSYMQGVIHLQRCEWEAAVEHLGRSAANRFIHHARAAVDSMAGLMLAQQALGREDDARETLQTLNEYVAPLGDPAMDSLAVSAEARLAIVQGQSEAARRWVDASEPPPEGALIWWLDIPSITRCRATIAAGSPGGLVKAEARLRDCAEVAEAQHNINQLIRVLTLLATACAEQGKAGEGLGILERAVTLARKGDFVLPFVELGTPMVDLLDQLKGERDFATRVERLVTAFGASPDGSARQAKAESAPTGRREGRRTVAGGTLEALTNRELDVLGLLALRLQNKEIAARLGISSQTVGSHLKQIYRKLGVQGRRKAVERAVECGVLDRRLPD